MPAAVRSRLCAMRCKPWKLRLLEPVDWAAMAPKQRQQNLPNRKQKKTPCQLQSERSNVVGHTEFRTSIIGTVFKKHHGMLAVLIVSATTVYTM